MSDERVYIQEQEAASWPKYESQVTLVFLSPVGVQPPKCPAIKRKAPSSHLHQQSQNKRVRRGQTKRKPLTRIYDESGDLVMFPPEVQKIVTTYRLEMVRGFQACRC